ncbi:GNAT family N-acetyltransferase [Saccharothrix sp. ST-888]|uniref:GNAT family N-acetyltransferase n=1 Tax=Saccharothrix sp. ST-888 TaxID=1427391 RepID=UPI0005ECA99A|nr:GNAT family N-acetyltransferase [Saccharothrix sp. ST-888]
MRPDGVTIRRALTEDGAQLAAIDHAAWSWISDVSPQPAEDAGFFHERRTPGQCLVAESDGVVVGYIRQVPPTPLATNRHIRQIQGFGVLPAFRGRGIGALLIDAAIDAARTDGIRRMTLRVLGRNTSARRLYERAGFTVDGILPEEFHLDGEYVDDVLMGRSLLGHDHDRDHG